MKSLWKYYRLPSGISKWVRGNSWVTKLDAHQYCIIGINGERVYAPEIESPVDARRHVDIIIRSTQP